MRIEAVAYIPVLAQFNAPAPPAPAQSHPVVETALGLGVAGLWLVAVVALLIVVVVLLPKLFSGQKRPDPR